MFVGGKSLYLPVSMKYLIREHIEFFKKQLIEIGKYIGN